jgi:hypothetical protein
MIKRRKAPSGTVGAGEVADCFGVSPKHVLILMNERLIPEVTDLGTHSVRRYMGRARIIPARWLEEIKSAPVPQKRRATKGARFRELVTWNGSKWGFLRETREGSEGPISNGRLIDFFWLSEGPNSKNGTEEEPAQFELPTEEGPRKISKEEIPAFRCSYEEFFGCTAEGSEYDVNLDIALREGRSPWAGMVTVKCKNMCATEVNGEIVDWWCNREGLAEPFEKHYNLKDPRREEIQRLRDEASASAAKADDLESELANG